MAIKQSEVLQQRLDAHTKIRDDLAREIKEKQRDLAKKETGIINITKQLNAAKFAERDPSIKITDHALVRYMERKLGVNRTDFIDQILTDNVRRLIKIGKGNGTFPWADGLSVVVKNYSIITITE